ncbi:MAG: bifunctional riboflavin kinase/FAD synthetase [Gammaproteobacteria bacterium]|nr:bifunctional riboflavin kinase/FAD synthetase [Gammaproteobacteria bacterium]
MEIIRGLHNIRERHRGSAITIGNFDGVHHGHRALLDALTTQAAAIGVRSTLITFEPLPREYFRGATVPARLTRFREKVRLLEPTGIDHVLCLPFNERLAAVTAQSVIDDFLIGQLQVRYAVIGDDFRFGRGREGDFAMLKAAGLRAGFEVADLSTLTFEQGRVSSTRIREALAAGDMALAEALLGHDYFIMGKVVYGRQLGRTLGIPTANIQLKRYRAAVEGVFAVDIGGLDRPYQGVANVGVRPTVDGRQPLLEVHLFDFDRDIYGARLTVRFRHRIRDERAFPSLDALKAQIHADMAAARHYFGTLA